MLGDMMMIAEDYCIDRSLKVTEVARRFKEARLMSKHPIQNNRRLKYESEAVLVSLWYLPKRKPGRVIARLGNVLLRRQS